MQSFWIRLFDRERYFLQTLIGFTRPFQLQSELAKFLGFPGADIANFAVVPALSRNWVSRALQFSPPLYSDGLRRATSSRLASAAAHTNYYVLE
jgi:hypothetical protein